MGVIATRRRKAIKSVEQFTANKSLRATDVDRMHQSDSTSALIVTVDDTTNTQLAVGDVALFERFKAGDLTFASSGSAVLDSEEDLVSVSAEQVVVSITKTAENRFLLVGKFK